MTLKEKVNDLFNRVKKGIKEEVKLPHYAQTREELGKDEFAGFYMPPEDIGHLKVIFEEGKGLTKLDLEAKIYDLFEGGTEERKKYIDLIEKPGEKHHFAIHDVETKKHIQDVFFTPEFEISAVAYGKVVPKKHTLVKVYKRIPDEVFEALNPYLKDMKELYEQAKKEAKPPKGIEEVEKEVKKTPEKVKPPEITTSEEVKRIPPDAILTLSDAIRYIELKWNASTHWTATALIKRGVADRIKQSEIQHLHNYIRKLGTGAVVYKEKPLSKREEKELDELIIKYQKKPPKELIIEGGYASEGQLDDLRKLLLGWSYDKETRRFESPDKRISMRAHFLVIDKSLLRYKKEIADILRGFRAKFEESTEGLPLSRLEEAHERFLESAKPLADRLNEIIMGKLPEEGKPLIEEPTKEVKPPEIITPPAIEEEEIGIPGSTFKALLERLKYTLSLTALYKKSDDFPWAEMSDEQMLAMTEAIARRKSQIITEQKHRVYYEDVLKRIQEATTDEDLERIRIEVEQSGLTNTAKEAVMNEIERKKKKEVPVTPLEPAEEAPLSTEVEDELRYLEMQRGFGQKMHPQIELSLKRLEDAGYPKEKIAELRIKFEPV